MEFSSISSVIGCEFFLVMELIILGALGIVGVSFGGNKVVISKFAIFKFSGVFVGDFELVCGQ